jgi:nucleotide-binding universal stress UspA family protein
VLTWSMPAVVGMATVALPSEVSIEGGARLELDEILKTHAENIGGRSADSPITSAIMSGSASVALLQAAENAELLVLGSRGHGGFAGLLLGSVSQQCAAHASCPVVIVHSPAH